MGDSDMTEPLEAFDEDVFVADLEDPAKKYAKMTKTAPKVAAPIPEEEEYIPQPFFGSKLMWVGLVWVAIVVVIIIVAVASTRDDDTTPTMAPTVFFPDNVTEVPEDTDAPNTTAPTAASSTTLSPTANATVAVTEAPSAANITLSPTVAGVINATDPPANLTLFDLLPEYSKSAIANPLSPQSFALSFVNYDPTAASRSAEVQLQRFALATQYFALGGRGWTNGSLTPTGPECDWFASTGSTCNDLGLQDTLMLEMNNLNDGPIPPEVGLLTALKVVDMSDNSIAGDIPTHFGLLQELEVLRLARNPLMTGSVPTELASIPTLKELDLSGLELLVGTIPEGLCDIPTLLFNCSTDLCGCANCPCASA
jgi:hypothetical protein